MFNCLTRFWRRLGVRDLTLLFITGAVLAAPQPAVPAEAPVRYLPDSKVWLLETNLTTYAVGINERNELQNLYWGKKLVRDQDFSQEQAKTERTSMREEYPGWGGMRFDEPCLKVTLNDGTRDLVLKYVSHQVRDDILQIRLKDIQYGLFVTLTYQVFARYDIIRKQTLIENHTSQPLVVESAQSGVWYVPPGDGYRLSYLSGRWSAEVQVMQEPIHQGKKVLESRRMVTSHQMNPWFAIDYQGRADEEHGRVWFGALGWSGNWKMVVEQNPDQQVRVVGGYNDFDFGYLLKPGESLSTPSFYGGHTESGFGEASRLMHHFERDVISPDRVAHLPRPVIFNSWCVTEFAVSETNQKEFAEKAAKLGAEHFMVDDGWFGARKNDRAGLGDWYPDPDKFPNGLKPLIDYVHGLGMAFGLWVEPEMVNRDSNLYRQHPDWVINFPGRPQSEGRNQLMLNMARQDVKEHMLAVLDKLLAENDIKILKWDMNRHISEPGWPEAPVAEQKQMWVKYITNYYEIIDRLRVKHPDVEFETCEGGGGRVDLGILSRVDQVATSDSTDPFDHLRIWEGYSMAYDPGLLDGYVIDNPSGNDRSTPLKYRLLESIKMGGPLGFSSNITKWSDDDIALAKKMVDYYKIIRRTLQQGDLYRLLSPREGDLMAAEYVGPDGKQAVLFAFLHSQQFLYPAPTIYLRGLDEHGLYRLKPIDDKLVQKQEMFSGSFLMNHGLDFRLRGDFDSTSLLLERVD